MSDALSRYAADETFADVKAFVHKLVNDFVAVYHLDKEEVISAAYFGYCQAYHTYDHSTEFTTWVGFKVNKRLLDLLRKTILERKGKVISLDDNLIDVPERSYEFNFVEWAETLSKAARTIASVAVYQPIDIRLLLAQMGEDSPSNWKYALREYCLERKWDPQWVVDAFTEIKERL
jgi:hypothetical protein